MEESSVSSANCSGNYRIFSSKNVRPGSNGLTKSVKKMAVNRKKCTAKLKRSFRKINSSIARSNRGRAINKSALRVNNQSLARALAEARMEIKRLTDMQLAVQRDNAELNERVLAAQRSMDDLDSVRIRDLCSASHSMVTELFSGVSSLNEITERLIQCKAAIRSFCVRTESVSPLSFDNTGSGGVTENNIHADTEREAVCIYNSQLPMAIQPGVATNEVATTLRSTLIEPNAIPVTSARHDLSPVLGVFDGPRGLSSFSNPDLVDPPLMFTEDADDSSTPPSQLDTLMEELEDASTSRASSLSYQRQGRSSTSSVTQRRSQRSRSKRRMSIYKNRPDEGVHECGAKTLTDFGPVVAHENPSLHGNADEQNFLDMTLLNGNSEFDCDGLDQINESGSGNSDKTLIGSPSLHESPGHTATPVVTTQRRTRSHSIGFTETSNLIFSGNQLKRTPLRPNLDNQRPGFLVEESSSTDCFVALSPPIRPMDPVLANLLYNSDHDLRTSPSSITQIPTSRSGNRTTVSPVTMDLSECSQSTSAHIDATIDASTTATVVKHPAKRLKSIALEPNRETLNDADDVESDPEPSPVKRPRRKNARMAIFDDDDIEEDEDHLPYILSKPSKASNDCDDDSRLMDEDYKEPSKGAKLAKTKLLDKKMHPVVRSKQAKHKLKAPDLRDVYDLTLSESRYNTPPFVPFKRPDPVNAVLLSEGDAVSKLQPPEDAPRGETSGQLTKRSNATTKQSKSKAGLTSVSSCSAVSSSRVGSALHREGGKRSAPRVRSSLRNAGEDVATTDVGIQDLTCLRPEVSESDPPCEANSANKTMDDSLKEKYAEEQFLSTLFPTNSANSKLNTISKASCSSKSSINTSSLSQPAKENNASISKPLKRSNHKGSQAFHERTNTPDASIQESSDTLLKFSRMSRLSRPDTSASRHSSNSSRESTISARSSEAGNVLQEDTERRGRRAAAKTSYKEPKLNRKMRRH